MKTSVEYETEKKTILSSYQDLNFLSVTVKVSVCINNWIHQTRSHHEAEGQQESSRLLKTSETT